MLGVGAALFAGAADLSSETLRIQVEIDEIIRDLAELNGRSFTETEAWVNSGGAERLLEHLETGERR